MCGVSVLFVCDVLREQKGNCNASGFGGASGGSVAHAPGEPVIATLLLRKPGTVTLRGSCEKACWSDCWPGF